MKREYSRKIARSDGGFVKVPYLISYAYLRKNSEESIRGIVTDSRRELLVDSGAFTAFNSGIEITLRGYLSFLGKWSNDLFSYMMLDKLQDPVTSATNYDTMLSEGFSPVPIHVFGDEQKRMDFYFERSNLVALGGLRRPHRGRAPVEYVKRKMEWAAGRHVHWLGYTSPDMVLGYRPFSYDSANAYTAAIWGHADCYIGDGRWVPFVRGKWMSRKDLKASDGSMVPHARLRAIVAEYELDPARLDVPNGWKDTAFGAHELTYRSWVRFSLDVRIRTGVRCFVASEARIVNENLFERAIDVAQRHGWADCVDTTVADESSSWSGK